jgi:hypothetical protein
MDAEGYPLDQAICSGRVSDQPAPPQLVALAEERSRARAAGDWGTADGLRARIEEAGWRIVDAGPKYTLKPAHAADVVVAGLTLHGTPATVPSRLDEAATTAATVIVVAAAGGPSPEPALRALAQPGALDRQVVVVAPADVPVDGPDRELVRTAAPFSPGDALQAGLRRATGAVVVVLEPDRIPRADVVAPMMASLDDPAVAVVGADGLVSADLRRFEPAGPGVVTALRSGCYAFRRFDAIARGPVPGQLHLPDSVARWWSLALRDEGPGAPPRRALALHLPLQRASHGPPADDGGLARRARRDAYRIADQFGPCVWLRGPREDVPGMPGDGAGGDGQGDDADEQGDPSRL